MKTIFTVISFSILFILIIIVFLRKKIYLNEGYEHQVDLNYFDQILYINLENRPDRQKQILNEFNKIGINPSKITRIDAVYEKYNGHIGCAKSHIKALELAINNNYENIVIFEDDFIFTKDKNDINKILSSFIKDFKNDWDVVMFTSVFKDLLPVENFNYINKVKFATTSSAYIIQKHFYRTLLNKLKNCLSKMEEEMIKWKKAKPHKKKYQTRYALDQCWASLQRRSKWYIFTPYLGTQGGEAGKSSIMSRF